MFSQIDYDLCLVHFFNKYAAEALIMSKKCVILQVK